MTHIDANEPLGALPIVAVPLAEGHGVLGLTFCPGKSDPMYTGGLWERDLPTDLGSIRAWGARALVTLLMDEEFDLLDVRALGEMAEAAGLDWYHLPIPDMAAPGWQFERRWVYAGVRLRRFLRRGGKVVIHCRVGLGRSGTIAARLLAELGLSAAEAISHVRKARPGAIHTAEQEAHVLTIRQIPPAQDEAVARRLACLLGGALGDGFGYAEEFDNRSANQKPHGLAGEGDPTFLDGKLRISNDTQMSLFTLEGLTRAMLLQNPIDKVLVDQIWLAYQDWLTTQDPRSKGGNQASRLLKHATMHVQRAPGKTSMSVLRQGVIGSPEQPVNDSKGCGGVMRASVVGLMPQMTPARAFRVAMRAAALTHGHPCGYLPAGLMATIVLGLLEDMPLHLAMSQAEEFARAWPGHEEVLARMHTAQNLTTLPFTSVLPEALGQGWVGDEALAIALYACSRSTFFREVMAIAGNHSGDSDSTASLAGQLFGAQHGLEALPHEWIRRLDVLDAALDLVDWSLPLWRRTARSAKIGGMLK